MGESRVAQVVIDVATRAFERAFDYAVPPELAGEVQVGCAVLVDFNHRPAVGYVVSLSDVAEVAEQRLKSIEALLGGPFFDEQAARLAFWVAHEYVAPLSDAVHLLTPPGPAPKAVRHVEPDGSVRWEVTARRTASVDERWARLTEKAAGYVPSGRAVRQQAVIDALAAGELRVGELAALCGTSVDAPLKALAAKGVVSIETRRRVRGREPLPPATGEDLSLTEGQQRALAAINQAVGRADGSAVLIDGVTGSGKTEVYLRAVRRVLDGGGGAVILVPEISLTPQTVGRFRSRFGDTVAVLHSRLSVGERYDQWDLLAKGEARVAIGPRSALFAPVRDLRLIIIDEEHESTYKQESSPRYHARAVAAELARQRGAALVLGSATPSIETLAACHRGACQRVELPERASGRPLPPVEVVDLGRQFAGGNRSMFSPLLAGALAETVEKGEKAVVLYNRRGFARFLLCRECGFVPRCEECSVSLTYHEGPGGAHLICHNCGRIYPVPPRCPQCASPYLRRVGKGTQQVEEQLRALFCERLGMAGADVPIIRMDADTVRTKGSHAQLLDRFSQASAGVLLGTQMIAKGLDFSDVTLAAVINADTSLNLPDFRAGERTYQLIEQVAGRAGRDRLPGRVVVQTYWPDHPAIRAAAAHDRGLFMEPELAKRRALGYPPYARLANLRVWGPEAGPVRDAAARLADALRACLSQGWLGADGDPQGEWQVLGPSPCLIERSRRAWQWHVLVKAPVGADLAGTIGTQLRAFKTPPGVSLAADIDPENLF